MRMGTMTLATVATALAVPLAGAALAQQGEPSPNVPVQNRQQPDYQPLGMRAGAFLIYPQLTLAGGYDSNVFATKTDEKDDYVAMVSPSISAQSQWSRHALNFLASLNHASYLDFSENDFTDYYLGTDGQIDITHADQLNLGANFSRGHDSRSDANEPQNAGGITQYYRYVGDAAYRHDFARFNTTLRGGYERYDYLDAVGNVDNSERDYDLYRVGLNFGYPVSPRFSLFVGGDYRWVYYDTTDSFGNKRNNQGYAVRAGTYVDITGILFGDFYVGYTAVTYDESVFDNASSPGVGGRLTWNVTPLTSIILNAVGSIKETTVTQGDEQASGDKYAEASLNVWHELRRNILLNAYGQYVRDDFVGIDRVDNTFRVGGGLRYLINRNFSLNAIYTYVTRNSDEADAEYDANQVVIGITAQL